MLDRGKPAAQITPPGDTSAELQRLAQAGLARLPIRNPTRDLWTRPLPKSDSSVSEALQQDSEDRLG